MKIFFNAFILLIFTAPIHVLEAQNLSNKIPADPMFVMELDLNILNSNMPMAEFKNLNLVKSVVSSFFPAIGDGSSGEQIEIDDLGLAESGKIYFTAYGTEGGEAYALLMPLADESKFDNYYEKSIGSILEEEANKSKLNDYNISDWSAGSHIAWGKSSLVFFTADKKWSSEDYENISWEEMNSMETGFIKDELSNLLNNSNTSNKPWKSKINAGKGAIKMWGDYGGFMKRMMDFGGVGMDAMGMSSMMNIYNSLYNGMELMVDVSFLAGKADMEMIMTLPKSFPSAKAMTSGKINKKFRKYIQGNNLLGLYSFAIDPEAYGEGMKEMIFQLYDQMPELMGMGRELGGLLGMFIDEQALYNFFKGDIVFACTGIQQYEKIVTSYQYDDDFNELETIDTITSQVPQVTAMISYGDELNLNRLLSIGEKLGGLIPVTNNYYELPISEFGTFYLAKHDGIIFLSNDKTLVSQKLTTGYTSSVLEKDVWKKMKGNSFYAYWDIPRTMLIANENGLPVGDQMVNMSKESLKNIELSAPRNQTGAYKSNFSFEFVNQKENALELMMNFVNDLFFSENGGRSL